MPSGKNSLLFSKAYDITTFTHEEVYELMNAISSDGKLSIEEFAELVYDPRYPPEIFDIGHQFVVDWRYGQRRLKELANQLLPYLEEQARLQELINKASSQKEIKKYTEQINAISADIQHWESKFNQLNAQYGG